MSTNWNIYGRGLARALFSALVAAMFLAVLLVASAQQEVLRRLDPGMSYSVARLVVSEAASARQSLAAEQKRRDGLGVSKRDLEQKINELQGRLFASMSSVDQIGEDIVHAKSCARLNADGMPQGQEKWGAVYGCYRDGTVPAADLDDIKALTDPANDPTRITEATQRAQFDLQSIDLLIAASDMRLKTEQETIDKSVKARDALQIVTLLDSSFIGFLGLTWVPPALMQILLCFLSGLFGALLITLVLLVYPNNDLSFSRTNSFWNRILLGGLIAVGVFVMIAGGVAVLGSSEAILNGQNNFMSFCAIGMLAGGFSDRFAKWLSDNATMLVSGQPKQLPAPDAEPVAG